MANKKRGPGRPPGSKSQATETIKTFAIESGIEMPTKGGRFNPYRDQVAAIIKKLKVTESVVFPIALKNLPGTIVSKEKLQIGLRKSIIEPDKKFIRFWRYA